LHCPQQTTAYGRTPFTQTGLATRTTASRSLYHGRHTQNFVQSSDHPVKGNGGFFGVPCDDRLSQKNRAPVCKSKPSPFRAIGGSSFQRGQFLLHEPIKARMAEALFSSVLGEPSFFLHLVSQPTNLPFPANSRFQKI